MYTNFRATGARSGGAPSTLSYYGAAGRGARSADAQGAYGRGGSSGLSPSSSYNPPSQAPPPPPPPPSVLLVGCTTAAMEAWPALHAAGLRVTAVVHTQPPASAESTTHTPASAVAEAEAFVVRCISAYEVPEAPAAPTTGLAQAHTVTLSTGSSPVPVPLAPSPSAAPAPLRGVTVIPSVTALVMPRTRTSTVGLARATASGSISTTPFTTAPAAAQAEPEMGFAHLFDAADIVFIATSDNFAFTAPVQPPAASQGLLSSTGGGGAAAAATGSGLLSRGRAVGSYGHSTVGLRGGGSGGLGTQESSLDSRRASHTGSTEVSTTPGAAAAAADVGNREGFVQLCVSRGKHVMFAHGVPAADTAALSALLETCVAPAAAQKPPGREGAGPAVKVMLEDVALATLERSGRLAAVREAMTLAPLAPTASSNPSAGVSTANPVQDSAVAAVVEVPRPLGLVRRVDLILCDPLVDGEGASVMDTKRVASAMDALLRRGVGLALAVMGNRPPTALQVRPLTTVPSASPDVGGATPTPASLEVELYIPAPPPMAGTGEELARMLGTETITVRLYLSVDPRGPSLTQDLTIAGTAGTLELHDGLLDCTTTTPTAAGSLVDGEGESGAAVAEASRAVVLVTYADDPSRAGAQGRVRRERLLYRYQPPSVTATGESATAEATATAACMREEGGAQRLAFWREVRRRLQQPTTTTTSAAFVYGGSSPSGASTLRGAAASPYTSRYAPRGSGWRRASVDDAREWGGGAAGAGPGQTYAVADAEAVVAGMSRLLQVQAVVDGIQQAMRSTTSSF